MKLLICACFCFLIFSPSKADPTVITSGNAGGVFPGVDVIYAFSLSGSGFSATARGEPFITNVRGELPGQSVVAITGISGGFSITTEVTFNGVTYRR